VFVTLHSLHLPRQALPMVGPRPPNGRLVTVAAARSGSSRPFPALDQALHSLASSCRAPSMAGCSVRSATAQEVQLKRKRESLALPLRVTGSYAALPLPALTHTRVRPPMLLLNKLAPAQDLAWASRRPAQTRRTSILIVELLDGSPAEARLHH